MKNEKGGSLKDGLSHKESIHPAKPTTRSEVQGQRPGCKKEKVGKFTIK
jgi:hypothetical protein